MPTAAIFDQPKAEAERPSPDRATGTEVLRWFERVFDALREEPESLPATVAAAVEQALSERKEALRPAVGTGRRLSAAYSCVARLRWRGGGRS